MTFQQGDRVRLTSEVCQSFGKGQSVVASMRGTVVEIEVIPDFNQILRVTFDDHPDRIVTLLATQLQRVRT